MWLAIRGFLTVVWSERIFHMTDRPFPQGILLFKLIVVPIPFTMIFQRET